MRVPALGDCRDDFVSAAAHADGYQTKSTLAPGPTGWQFQFTPYGWLPWVNGDAVINGREFAVSEDPVQVLEIARLRLDELHAGAARRHNAVLRRHLC